MHTIFYSKHFILHPKVLHLRYISKIAKSLNALCFVSPCKWTINNMHTIFYIKHFIVQSNVLHLHYISKIVKSLNALQTNFIQRLLCNGIILRDSVNKWQTLCTLCSTKAFLLHFRNVYRFQNAWKWEISLKYNAKVFLMDNN